MFYYHKDTSEYSMYSLVLNMSTSGNAEVIIIKFYNQTHSDMAYKEVGEDEIRNLGSRISKQKFIRAYWQAIDAHNKNIINIAIC